MSKLTDYDVEKVISKGGNHSVVHAATHKETGTTVAIKQIKIFQIDPSVRKEVETEISLLQKLDHPNLIQYHEHFYHHEGDLYIVMELATGGQMAQKVETVRKSGVRVEQGLLWGWLHDVASALAYLHGRRVLHRDVKPSHIFEAENGTAKLGDFGLSKVMSAKTQIAFSCVGTPYYMSPELVRGQGYAFGSDVWSLGCSIYELAAGYSPFFRADMDFYALGDAICSARYPELPADAWSGAFIAVIHEILEVDPQKRPPAQRILDITVCNRVGRIKEFEVLGTIGRGKFSEVHRAIRKSGQEGEVALKRVQVFEMDTQARKDCISEVNLLKSLNHLTIVRYLDSFLENSELVIVLELAPFGDLAGLCRCLKEKNGTLNESQIWATIFQVSDALSYMHRKRYMHRDIKPANVFLCNHGIVKLGDLGLGRYFSSNTYRAHSVVGTPFYMSPEVITTSGGYSFKSDVWSLGCVLYELAALTSPFACSRLNFYALGKKICNGEYDPLPESASRTVQKLCSEMIQVKPDDRPDARAVFEAAGEQFAVCTPIASIGDDVAGKTEPTNEVGRMHRQLMRAAGVVRAMLEVLGLAVPSTEGTPTAPPWSAGSSAYPSQASAVGSAMAYIRSNSLPETTSTSVRRHSPSGAYAELSSLRGLPPDSAREPRGDRERVVSNSSVPRRPERAPPQQYPPHHVPTPPGAPPPQHHREDCSAVGLQSYGAIRRRHVPAPSGSLSARASSRDRLPMDVLARAGRRALTPERVRYSQPIQMSPLRFVGGAIVPPSTAPESLKAEAKAGLPPLSKRTPRELSREAYPRNHYERGSGDLNAPPPMPPSARPPVTPPDNRPGAADELSPTRRPVPRAAPAVIPISTTAASLNTGVAGDPTSMRLPGATTSVRTR